jgi:hypothetical protein
MYDSFYAAMVESGVAEKTNAEQMYEKDANVVSDKALMCRQPTKYKMLYPEKLLS